MTQIQTDPPSGANPPSQPVASVTPDPAIAPIWPAQSQPPKWKRWHTIGLAAIMIAILLLGLLPVTTQRIWSWLGTLVLLAGFATVTGHGILGLWTGLLIDERNKMSLSRLQMILWTIIVLSGFLTAALWRIRVGQMDALAIGVPSELWLLMGIATTSLLGSPLIKSTQMAQPITDEQVTKQQQTFALLANQGIDPNIITTEGQIVSWKWPKDATWSDLFQGEKIGNAAHLDLGKIQMFYFTLILALAYVAMLGTLFSSNQEPIKDLPSLSEGMVTLLGISHAGYLVNKVIPHD